jgi:uncharacterized protein with HEPN domain
LRLIQLCRVVERERKHLLDTTGRLFVVGFDQGRVAALEADPILAERVEAFVSRFGRLQDTLGDKLIPAVLAALGERLGPVADMLDRAERLGFVTSVDDWFTMRSLRNKMVHEYVEDATVLWGALKSGSDFVPVLAETAQRLLDEVGRRGWQTV